MVKQVSQDNGPKCDQLSPTYVGSQIDYAKFKEQSERGRGANRVWPIFSGRYDMELNQFSGDEHRFQVEHQAIDTLSHNSSWWQLIVFLPAENLLMKLLRAYQNMKASACSSSLWTTHCIKIATSLGVRMGYNSEPRTLPRTMTLTSSDGSLCMM